jgi:hypothetical protein
MEITMDAPLAKPIIYCILNPNDSVQYLRIGRVFLGSQGALSTARDPDSIYFKQVNAWLERIESDSIKEILTFQANDNQIKDTGLFSNSKGGLFQLSRKILPGATYRLKVEIPELNLTAVAETQPQAEMTIIHWNGWPGNAINMVNDRYSTVQWGRVPTVDSYELFYLFRYYNLTDRDTTAHHVIWRVPDVIFDSDPGDPLISYRVPISQWFGVLSDHIPRLDSVKRRIAGKFDLIWEFKGSDFDDFVHRSKFEQQLYVDYPAFSNIENGIGIFSFASCYRIARIGISLYTLERITTHPLTKDLKFDARTDW